MRSIICNERFILLSSFYGSCHGEWAEERGWHVISTVALILPRHLYHPTHLCVPSLLALPCQMMPECLPSRMKSGVDCLVHLTLLTPGRISI